MNIACYSGSLGQGAAFVPVVARRGSSVHRPTAREPEETEAERSTRLLLDRIERHVADTLFRVHDLDEFEEALEELLHDRTLFDCQKELAGTVTLDMVAKLAEGVDIPDWLRAAVGPEAQAKLNLITQLICACSRAVVEVFAFISKVSGGEDVSLESIAAQLEASQAEQGIEPGPLAFLHDRTLPAAFKRALLARDRSEVLSVAMGALEGRKVAPWLVSAILDNLIVDLRERLRFAAALPGTTPPDEDLVPASERIDIQHIAREFEAAEAGYQQRLLAARVLESDFHPTPDE